MSEPLAYRAEIDGLRAIAVCSVVLYHAGLGWAGFVGVDVFFVISGYLITSLLLREQPIDLLAFYARRARRILPAALVLIVAVLAVSPILLGSSDLTQVRYSAAASAAFLANVFFQLTTGGYFDPGPEQMPLLHLWSLSVEEQFYLVWPALLMFVRRKLLLPVLILSTVVSFGLAEWLIATHPQSAFYQMPARFWELASGGIIAAMPNRPQPRQLAPIGIALTVAACVLPAGHFPGLGALPAVAGACMVIAAVHGGASNSLLASRPFVGLGLISYSLYLWHWPLLAFYRATTAGDTSLQARLSLCVLAVLLAIASYRYVERPFRVMTIRKGWTLIVGLLASAALAFAALAPIKPPAVMTPAEQARNDMPHQFIAECAYMPMESLSALPKPGCTANSATTVTLWGDSMAIAWQPMVEELDSEAATFTRAGCPPVIGYTDATRATIMRDLCAGFNARVLPMLSGDTLVMAAHWNIYPGIDNALASTLAQVAPRFKRVILMGETPTLRDDIYKCIQTGTDCAIPRATYEALKGPIKQRLESIARIYPHVEYLDPADFFCDSTTCPAQRNGHWLYTDSHHISRTASQEFGRRWRTYERAPGAKRAASEFEFDH